MSLSSTTSNKCQKITLFFSKAISVLSYQCSRGLVWNDECWLLHVKRDLVPVKRDLLKTSTRVREARGLRVKEHHKEEKEEHVRRHT